MCEFTYKCWQWFIVSMMIIGAVGLTIGIINTTDGGVINTVLLPDGITTRVFVSADAVDGYITTATVNDGITDVNYEINFVNVDVECDLPVLDTICDATMPFTYTADCTIFGSSVCVDDRSCVGSNLCFNHRLPDHPTCSFLRRRVDVCIAMKYTTTNCYDMRLLNPTHCRLVGEMLITNLDTLEEDSFSITDTNSYTVGTYTSMEINSINYQLPFSGELPVLDVDTMGNKKVVEKSELCAFNDAVGCRGPVRIDNDIKHAKQSPIVRAIWGSAILDLDRRREFVDITNNRKIATFITKHANYLDSLVGSHTFNATSASLRFEQHMRGNILFFVDITATSYVGETFLVCPIISVEADCSGLSTEPLMDCTVKITTGHTKGKDIKLHWLNEERVFECISQTKEISAIPRTEGEIIFTLTSEGATTITSKTTPLIEHPLVGEDDEVEVLEGGDGKEVSPLDPLSMNTTLFYVWIIVIVASSIILAVALIAWVIVAWWFKECFFHPSFCMRTSNSYFRSEGTELDPLPRPPKREYNL